MHAKSREISNYMQKVIIAAGAFSQQVFSASLGPDIGLTSAPCHVNTIATNLPLTENSARFPGIIEAHELSFEVLFL
jgi:hypothetical protein